jgi:hypothetical protein
VDEQKPIDVFGQLFADSACAGSIFHTAPVEVFPLEARMRPVSVVVDHSGFDGLSRLRLLNRCSMTLVARTTVEPLNEAIPHRLLQMRSVWLLIAIALDLSQEQPLGLTGPAA